VRDRRSISAPMSEAVLQLAAVRGDPAFYDKLLQAYAKSNDPQEQRDLRSTIAKFIAPKLAVRTLEWTLTPAVRTQDAGSVMSEVLSTPAIQQQAWDYYIRNWDRMTAKLPQWTTGGGRGGPIVAVAAICDPALRDAVAAALK